MCLCASTAGRAATAACARIRVLAVLPRGRTFGVPQRGGCQAGHRAVR